MSAVASPVEETSSLVKRASALLAQIVDPEIPVLTIAELGLLRAVQALDEGDAATALEVVITPTYSGCPAVEQIEQDIVDLLASHGITARVRRQLAPAWSSDWLSEAARAKLQAFGIAPPCGTAASAANEQVIHFHPARQPACPRCASTRVQELSFFGSTACKAQYRCLACREPFDYFKPY